MQCEIFRRGLLAPFAMGLVGGFLGVAQVNNVYADATADTVCALRISGMIAGGALAPSSPEYAEILGKCAGGDYYGAALAALNSAAGTRHLVRRLAKQMMNPGFDASGVLDNDATLFIIANLTGSGTGANISKLWSEDATYVVRIMRGDDPVELKIGDLTPAELRAVDFRTAIVRRNGQTVRDRDNKPIALPVKHVGGYLTLSDRRSDTSIAEYGLSAGTNLRMIAALYATTMGFKVEDLASTTDALIQYAPRFVDASDSNFFVGKGQPACLSCHGGGSVSITKGYSVFADVLDYSNVNGLTYRLNVANSPRKSLGSAANLRNSVQRCNTGAPNFDKDCNPESLTIDSNQGWDLASVWGSNGTLNRMGWTGPTSGQGLNALGSALGRAKRVYTFMVERVIKEICPLHSISDETIARISQEAYVADDFKHIVARVASEPTCR